MSLIHSPKFPKDEIKVRREYLTAMGLAPIDPAGETQGDLVAVYPRDVPNPLPPGNPFLIIINEAVRDHDIYGRSLDLFRRQLEECCGYDAYGDYTHVPVPPKPPGLSEKLRNAWFSSISERMRAEMAFQHLETSFTEAFDKGVETCFQAILGCLYKGYAGVDEADIQLTREQMSLYRAWTYERCVLFPAETARRRVLARAWNDARMHCTSRTKKELTELDLKYTRIWNDWVGFVEFPDQYREEGLREGAEEECRGPMRSRL